MLKGDPCPASPKKLTTQGKEALHKVKEALTKAQLQRVNPTRPLRFIIFPANHHPMGCFWQTSPLYWMTSPISSSKVVLPYHIAVSNLLFKTHQTAITIFGKYIDEIIIPYTPSQLQALITQIPNWTLLNYLYPTQWGRHYPADKICQFYQSHPHNTQKDPIPRAKTVFTDGSGKEMAAIVADNKCYTLQIPHCSAQQAELKAIVYAFQLFSSKPINIYTESYYTANTVPTLEEATIISPCSAINSDLTLLQTLIHTCLHPFWTGHIRSHTNLPGPLAEGNAKADITISVLATVTSPALEDIEKVTTTKLFHSKFHNNHPSLNYKFGLSSIQARTIVTTCPVCAPFTPHTSNSICPRDVKPNKV